MDATIKSARRTLAVFEYFSKHQKRATVMEISHSLEMPHSSVSALLKSLVTLGYLDHDPQSRTYYPTISICLLGHWMNRRVGVPGMLADLLWELSCETGMTSAISLRNDIYSQLVYVHQNPDDPNAVHVGNGVFAPLVCSSTGWSLLTDMSDDAIGRLVRRTQCETPVSRWRDTAKDALKNVNRTRQNGYAMSNGETRRGYAGIAICLPSIENTPQLTISAGGPISDIKKKKDRVLGALQMVSDKTRPEALKEFLFRWDSH